MQWAEYVSNLTKKYKNNQNEYDLLDRLENTLTTDGFPTIGSIITSRLIIIVFEDYIIPPIPIAKGWNRIIFNNRWYYTFNHNNVLISHARQNQAQHSQSICQCM